ncbi:hypothetical protein CHUAL_001860 [Chamberlinius hualienensis]
MPVRGKPPSKFKDLSRSRRSQTNINGMMMVAWLVYMQRLSKKAKLICLEEKSKQIEEKHVDEAAYLLASS